jgi:aspartate/methionine/tyrosine aminotransferase
MNTRTKIFYHEQDRNQQEKEGLLMKLPPFGLERYFAKHEFSAPYLLCCSDCESLSVRELMALAPEAEGQLASLWLGYTESQGHPELRRQIASLYNDISADEVLVHSGAEEVIFNFMNTVLSPDDHMILHSPYYQSLGEVARGLGAEVTEWEGDMLKNWQLDLNFLEYALTTRTKVVVINFPHNPTGSLPDKAFLMDLAALSNKHGFIVFSDEVYRFLEYNQADRLPAFCELDDRALSLGVMSKSFGLAGLRIGWAVTRNKTLYDQLAAFKDYTTICNGAPSEFLSTLALKQREVILARNRSIISENLKRLHAFFTRYASIFRWIQPKAGPIAFPQLLKGSVDSFCQQLISEKGVLLLPGTLYGEKYNCFRIGFGRRNMPECLDQMNVFVESWSG